MLRHIDTVTAIGSGDNQSTVPVPLPGKLAPYMNVKPCSRCLNIVTSPGRVFAMIEGRVHIRHRRIERLISLSVLLAGLGALIAVFTTSLAVASVPTLKPDLHPLSRQPGIPGNTSGKTAGKKIPGHYIVVFENSVDNPGTLAKAQIARQGGELGFVYHQGIKGYSAQLSSGAVAALRRDPQVKYVAPDRYVEAYAQSVPTGVRRIGTLENSVAGIDGKDTRVDADVAVIDTGIDYQHPDLNVYKRTNCVPSGENLETEGKIKSCTEGSGTDGNGHGTHVAGTIGALDNEIGVVGVAPGARLWSVRVLNNEGAGSESWIVAGVEWVTAHAGEIEVANMSLGGPEGVTFPAMEEAVNASVAAGVVYVVAAGNSSGNVSSFSPAKNPNVISVEALVDYDGNPGGEAGSLINDGSKHCEEPSAHENYGDDDTLAWFSNYGATIAAPGVCVLSTWTGKQYAYLDGTSMASPHVAGAAALLASKANPNSKADVESIRSQLVTEGSQSWTDIASFWGFKGLSSEIEHFEFSWDSSQKPLVDLRPAGAATYTTRASGISYTEATLRGGSNPNGEATNYVFEYGPTSKYGYSSPETSKAVGSGTQDVVLTSAVKGLKPNTTYHFRLATIGETTKKTTYGADKTFTMPPAIKTRPATGVMAGQARLEASTHPSGQEMSYKFEYGTSEAYGNSIAALAEGIGAGVEGEIRLSRLVEKLSANTSYHYRLTATYPDGSEEHGKDQTFHTTSSRILAEPYSVFNYPVHFTGTSTHEAEFVVPFFSPKGNLLTCSEDTLSGELEGGEMYGEHTFVMSKLNLTPDYSHCKFPEVKLEVIMNLNGCRYEFYPGGLNAGFDRQDGTVDIGPPGCGPIKVVAAGCVLSIPSQAQHLNGGSRASFYNEGSGTNREIRIAALSFKDLEYKQEGIGCGKQGANADGEFAGNWKLSATNKQSERLGLWFTNNFKIAPTVNVLGASKVSASEATVNASINPNYLSTEYWFQYVNDAEYQVHGWENAITTAKTNIAAGNTAVKASSALQGLKSRTTYHYRIAASNSTGLSYSEDTFGTWGEWSLASTANPANPPTPLTEAKLEGISCASSSMCMAVGENKQQKKAFAEVWNGSEWKVPLGGESSLGEGFADGIRYGVSCPSTAVCEVVGTSSTGTPVAESWIELPGSGWYRQVQGAKTPEGATKVVLRDVSCTSTSACTAVGSYVKESKTKTLAERWNGSSWSVQTTPNPESGSAELLGVSCDSASSCRAVGKQGSNPYGMAWNGTSWSTATVPNPSGSKSAFLQKVSCASSTSCMAVGSYYDGTTNKTLAERWNGSSWSVSSSPNPAEAKSGEIAGSYLLGVSCASSSSCTAVGRYVNATESFGLPTEEKTLAESWGGSEWAIQATTNPEGMKYPKLNGVSCVSSISCKAVGWATGSSQGSKTVTLGEKYE